MSGELVTPTGASLVRALCGMSALFRDDHQDVRVSISSFVVKISLMDIGIMYVCMWYSIPSVKKR